MCTISYNADDRSLGEHQSSPDLIPSRNFLSVHTLNLQELHNLVNKFYVTARLEISR